MESIIFVVIMMAGHLLMMFIMPGMHGGHYKHTEGSATEMKKLENENQQLREELKAVKSRINQDSGIDTMK